MNDTEKLLIEVMLKSIAEADPGNRGFFISAYLEFLKCVELRLMIEDLSSSSDRAS